MNKSAIIRIIIWSIVAVLSLTILLFGIISDTNSFGFISTYYDDEELYSVCYGRTEITEEINKLDINWVDGNISVDTHDGDEIIINEYGVTDEDSRLRYLVRDNKLIIQPRKSERFISDGSIPKKDLVVLIPKSMASLLSLEVDNISGEIKIAAVEARSVRVESVSAEIYISGVTANELDLEIVSADIDAEGSFDNIAIESVSGNTKITSAVCPRELEADAVSGNFVIYIPEDSEFTVELDAVSSRFSSDFTYTKRGDNYIVGAGGADFTIDGVSGNIDIKKIAK